MMSVAVDGWNPSRLRSNTQAMFSLEVPGAIAQLERALIAERTKAAIRATKTSLEIRGFESGARKESRQSRRRVRLHLDELNASA